MLNTQYLSYTCIAYLIIMEYGRFLCLIFSFIICTNTIKFFLNPSMWEEGDFCCWICHLIWSFHKVNQWMVQKIVCAWRDFKIKDSGPPSPSFLGQKGSSQIHIPFWPGEICINDSNILWIIEGRSNSFIEWEKNIMYVKMVEQFTYDNT